MSRIPFVPLLATALATTVLAAFPASVPSAHAMPSSVVVKPVGTLKKTFRRSFTEYGAKVMQTICYPRGGCYGTLKGYRVARGTVEIRLTSYLVQEKIKAYDYYVLEYDVNVVRRSGSSDAGIGTFGIGSPGPSLHEHRDTKSLSAREQECDEITFTLGTPWPVVSASTDVGAITFCDEEARLSRTTSGLKSRYRANMLRHSSHLVMQRWVEVKRGVRPKFSAMVSLPDDTCTKADDGWCKEFTRSRTGARFALGTRGGLGSTDSF